MPGLRDILDAATRGPWSLEDGAPWRIVEARGHFGTPAGVPDQKPRRAEADAALAALAPELAALVLDMGETLNYVSKFLNDAPNLDAEVRALLARLSRLGAGDSNQNEKEQT